MLAYEELQGARGREIRYRPPRYPARTLFPHMPPKLRVGSSAYQIQNLSLGGLAAIAKGSDGQELSVGETVRLVIQQSGLPIFESDARVRWAEKTVFGSKVAFSFVDRVIELDKLISRNLQAQIATRASTDSEAAALVPQEYRAFCAETLRLLRGYRAAIDANMSVPQEFVRDFDHAGIFEASETQLVQEWRTLWRTGNDLARSVMGERDRRDAVKQFTEIVLTPELRAGAIWDRSYSKPLGYPGDFSVMNQVYDWERVGTDAYQMLLHRLGLEVAECIKTRMEVVRGEIGKLVSTKESGRVVRILNLGCGSAREVETWLARGRPAMPRVEFTLIDQEQLALDYAYRAAYPHIVRNEECCRLNCLNISFADVLRGINGMGDLPPQDLIYSVGLLDYLSDRRAAALVRRLYQLLLPGGLLIIGNMDETPLSNLWPMEFITDWSLYYRSEPQMLAWAKGLDPAAAWTETESTGRVRLLYIRKR
jgi:SAM-dependent methyltransferase